MLVESALAAGGISTATQSPSGFGSEIEELSDVFLNLLLKELSNQDPLNPVDGSEFVAQLAQLGSVEQMQKMNANLELVIDSQELSQASTLIGRHVEATASDGTFVAGVVTSANVVNGAVNIEVANQTVPISGVISVRAADLDYVTILANYLDEEALSKTYNFETEV